VLLGLNILSKNPILLVSKATCAASESAKCTNQQLIQAFFMRAHVQAALMGLEAAHGIRILICPNFLQSDFQLRKNGLAALRSGIDATDLVICYS
jgi:hypothetical protein